MTQPLTTTPPGVTYHNMPLPQTDLHYAKCGAGPPLVMVPATISEIGNWLGLAQFLGQWFTTYFFELPGHGRSTPFAGAYSADRVAHTVEDLIDALGHERISLMGFSFGGILALKTMQRLGERVERVILFAPCVSQRALRHGQPSLILLRRFNRLVSRPWVQRRMLQIAHDEQAVDGLMLMLRKWCRVETNEALRQKLLRLPASTLHTLTGQIEEVLTCEFDKPDWPFQQPCLLGMSPYDPLLAFDVTHAIVAEHFSNLTVARFPFRFHQPPRPFTPAELNHHAGELIHKWAAGPAAPSASALHRRAEAGQRFDRPAPADVFG